MDAPSEVVRSAIDQTSTELLNYTVRGQLDGVRECLRRNRDLVHAKEDVTDLSDRHFSHITGFQYAIWAGDEELWNIFLEFLPEADAYNQLMELMNKRPDIVKTHGAPLSFFDPLLTAYQRYRENFFTWEFSQREACWQKEVGGAQQNMPAWFIYVFSEEGVDKAWRTKQMTIEFTRNFEQVKAWFAHEHNSGKCGNTFAFHHGVSISPGAVSVCSGQVNDAQGFPYFMSDHELENSAALKADRTQKLALLTERLSQPSKAVSENQVSPSVPLTTAQLAVTQQDLEAEVGKAPPQSYAVQRLFQPPVERTSSSTAKKESMDVEKELRGHEATFFKAPEPIILGCEQTFSVRGSGLACLTLLQNGNIISGAHNGELTVWNTKAASFEKKLSVNSDYASLLSLGLLPEGKIVSAGNNANNGGIIKLWILDENILKCEHEFLAHTKGIQRLTVLTDGSLVSVGRTEDELGEDLCEIKVWNTKTFECERKFSNHMEYITSLVRLPDESLVSASNLGIRLFTAKTWAYERMICTEPCSGLTVLPNGTLISISISGKKIKIWDTNTFVCKTQLSAEVGNYINALHGGRLASKSTDSRNISLYNMKTLQCEQVISEPCGSMGGIISLPDGRLVSYGSNLRVWKDKNYLPSCIEYAYEKSIVSRGYNFRLMYNERISDEAIKPNELYLYISNDCLEYAVQEQAGKVVRVQINKEDLDARFEVIKAALQDSSKTQAISATSQEVVSKIAAKRGHSTAQHSIYCLSLLPDGRVVSGGLKGFQIWNVKTSVCEKTIENDVIYSIAILSDGRLVTGGKGIKIWNTHTFECEKILSEESPSSCLVSLPDGRLASAHGKTIKIWSANTFECEKTLSGSEYYDVSCMAIMSNGSLVSGENHGGSLKIWNLKTFMLEKKVSSLVSYLASLIILPDGRWVVGGGSNPFYIVNENTQQVEYTFEGCGARISALPEGRIVTMDHYGNFKIWNLKTLTCEQDVLSGVHGYSCSGLVVLPDGRIVMGNTGGENGIKIYENKATLLMEEKKYSTEGLGVTRKPGNF